MQDQIEIRLIKITRKLKGDYKKYSIVIKTNNNINGIMSRFNLIYLTWDELMYYYL